MDTNQERPYPHDNSSSGGSDEKLNLCQKKCDEIIRDETEDDSICKDRYVNLILPLSCPFFLSLLFI